jgi:subtilisin family serine protease
MQFPIKTKKYNAIISSDEIYNYNNVLVSGNKISRSSSIDDIINEVKFNNKKAVVADKKNLYVIARQVNKVTTKEKDLAEQLINYYSNHQNLEYIGIVKNNKSIVLDKDDLIWDIIKKAVKPNIARSSKKKLIQKVNELIETKFSYNPFFKKIRCKIKTKEALNIPETTFSSRLYGAVSICTKKAINSLSNRTKNIQEELDRNFFNKKRQDLIINVKSNNNIQKTDLADQLSKTFGSKEYYIFKNIPYVAVPCSINDVNKLMLSLNDRKNIFGIKSNYFNLIKNTERSRGFYIPELYLQVAKDNNYLSYKSNKINDQGWNLKNINAPKAWNITKGLGSTALIIDTGVEYNHTELKECFNENKGYNFVKNNNNPKDDNGHGTHVAGIVSGYSCGVSPDSKLVAAKVLDNDGSGSNTDVIRAIDYAINEKNIDVINMSLGSSYYSYALNTICKAAYNNGIIVCAAAGNEGYGAEYPAACDGVISVAAVDYNNKHAKFSNIHNSVDISSPGVSIFSTYLGNGYKQLSGTSMATPHVAGVANLCVSVKNNLDNQKFEKLFVDTSLILGAGESYQKEKYGAGLIQADKLVDRINNLIKYRWKLW